jgi:diacylglycerol kinase family enzyme
VAVTAVGGVHVIVNLNARGLSGASALRELICDTARDGSARVYLTASLAELDEATAEIASNGARAVVLAGGDGSHMNGLSSLVRAHGGGQPLPPVALAPGGTVGTIARNLGRSGSVNEWTTRLLRAVLDGDAPSTRTATLRVSDDGGGVRVGFIFGAGLVARFFDLYYQSARPGQLAAAGIAARVFAGALVGGRAARFVLEPIPARLHVDGRHHPARAWSLVLASVLRDLGLHMRATYRGGESRDRFHAVASGLPPHALALQLANVLAGRPLTGEPRLDALAEEFRVVFQDPSYAYVLDGDIMHARSVTITMGPRVSLLVPR